MTSHGFINNESCSACPDDAGNIYKVKRKDKQTTTAAKSTYATSHRNVPCLYQHTLAPLAFSGGPCQLPGISRGVLRIASIILSTDGHHLHTHCEDTPNMYPGQH